MLLAFAGCGGTTVVTQTTTQPVTTTTATSPPTGGHHYEGNGNAGLGTIKVPQESVIVWKAEPGGIFTVVNPDSDRHFISLRSQAGSGTSVIPAGTYHDVSVQAYGSWSFDIQPR